MNLKRWDLSEHRCTHDNDIFSVSAILSLYIIYGNFYTKPHETNRKQSKQWFSLYRKFDLLWIVLGYRKDWNDALNRFDDEKSGKAKKFTQINSINIKPLKKQYLFQGLVVCVTLILYVLSVWLCGVKQRLTDKTVSISGVISSCLWLSKQCPRLPTRPELRKWER